ncbi:hypothetical protein QBC44DRAFT_370692 [Cladorrhinum sp. PSN332]|nr:hypothetical protein QBC44DRAFT_370692 [Cladorrhinum sp. PSN332]
MAIFEWKHICPALFIDGKDALPSKERCTAVGMGAIEEALETGHGTKELLQNARVAAAEGEMEPPPETSSEFILREVELYIDRLADEKDAVGEGYDIVKSCDDEAATASRHLGSEWEVVQPAPETVTEHDERGWIALADPAAIKIAIGTANNVPKNHPVAKEGAKTSFFSKAVLWATGPSRK